jgi:hypothetical protein
MSRLFLAACTAAFLFFACSGLFARSARADTLEAPVGGKPFVLGGGRVACMPGTGAWRVDPSGRALRPPTSDTAIGAVVELKVAANFGECAKTPTIVRLVATAPWPTFDASSITLALDEGRLEAKGRGLRGALVTWPVEPSRASDTCRAVKNEGPVETCTWAVPKTSSADPATSTLRWQPAGSQIAPDAVFYDAEGRLAVPEMFTITPARVEVIDLLPSDASIDVSSGTGRTPLTHEEAVVGVDCANARCSLDSGELVMQAPPAAVVSVDVKFRLTAHVFFVRKNPPETQPVLRVSILRCPMGIVSGAALRGVDTARVVVRVEGGCMKDVTSLRFFVGGRQAEVLQTETAKDAAYAVVTVGSLEASAISITAVRGEGDSTVVAVARTETRPAPIVRTVLQIPGYPPLDFIPNNRPAVVNVPTVSGAALTLLPIDDVYAATTGGGLMTAQGDINAVGLVALVFGYRVPTLPAPLDQVNLGVLEDTLRRPVKEANVPAPFGLSASAMPDAALAEVVCSGSDKAVEHAVPGVTLRMSFRDREGCRVIIHRERLSPEYGTQKLTVEILVNKLDGTSRPDSHVTQTLILTAGPEPRIAWVKGVVDPYDRVIIRLSHVADEAHYLGANDLINGAPAVQWNILFGTGHVRLYATTAIPTGLYRFGNSSGSGILSLSLAVISRLTWLDSDGHEGLLGLEAGIMAFGFTNSSAQSLTEVGIVAGVGLSIPLAGAGSPTQASINLHAWFEQRISEPTTPAATATMVNPIPASARAVIIGPSISFGNVGTTF